MTDINILDVKKKTNEIREQLYDLEEIENALAVLGISNYSLTYIHAYISLTCDEIDVLVKSYLDQEYNRAVDSSTNILKTALTVSEMKENNDD